VPNSWKSSKQKAVSLSSCESEYYSISEGAKELIDLKRLIWELENKVPYDEEVATHDPTDVYEDNQSCLKILLNKNDVRPSNLRHIRMRYHWIRDCIRNGEFIPYYIRTDKQLADGFTKSLSPKQHFPFMDAVTRNS